MIRRYNLKQLLLAVLALAGSAIAYGCAWLFFRWVPLFAAWQFGLDFPPGMATGIAVACLLVLTVSGDRVFEIHGRLLSGMDHAWSPGVPG